MDCFDQHNPTTQLNGNWILCGQISRIVEVRKNALDLV